MSISSNNNNNDSYYNNSYLYKYHIIIITLPLYLLFTTSSTSWRLFLVSRIRRDMAQSASNDSSRAPGKDLLSSSLTSAYTKYKII